MFRVKREDIYTIYIMAIKKKNGCRITKIFNLQWHKTEEKLPILTFQRLEPSHGSRDDNVSLSVHRFGSWNISTNTARIAMNLCTDVHGLPRGSIPTDLTDPLTFLLLPLAGQCCHFSSEISHDIHSFIQLLISALYFTLRKLCWIFFKNAALKFIFLMSVFQV